MIPAHHPVSSPKLDRISGFTLVELMVVIALIGVIATIGIATLNPTEQFARTRDAQRRQNLNLMAKALVAYSTDNKSTYPPPVSDTGIHWSEQLTSGGYITTIPQVSGTAECIYAANIVGNYCYRVSGTDIAIYTRLQSKQANSLCSAGQARYFVWRSRTEQFTEECASTTSGGSGEPGT